jgi:hypothetical protein
MKNDASTAKKKGIGLTNAPRNHDDRELLLPQHPGSTLTPFRGEQLKQRKSQLPPLLEISMPNSAS